MNKEYKEYVTDTLFLIWPFILLFSPLRPLAEKYIIGTENTIAYISDYSFVFLLPMAFFLAFLLSFIIKMIRLKKRENKVWNPLEKTDRKSQIKWKAGFSLICIFIFIICSLILCAGTLRRTVITDDYTVKNYNFAGQVNAEYKPENIRFMKIYPEAEYLRSSGFDHMYAVIEIYINDDDCFIFTSSDFYSFEQIREYKKAVEKHEIKVYFTDRAYNEPDPDTHNLDDEDLEKIENFYAEYEKIK